MIRHGLAAAALLALAACGADGAPTAPAKKSAETGITLTGEARAGVARLGTN